MNIIDLVSLEMMEFLIDIVDQTSKLYPKICHNLSSAYSLLDDYENSLKYADLGIEYCKNKRSFNGLNLLYYNKGVAEYTLGHKSYIESLDKSISFCNILEQDELKNVILHKCKRFYNINIM
ncbi:hypothetical protein RBU61_19065 [Tissierella sp. MB52-C2]|uniref:hypothetical protein n=1 Tax=Tissierella sp. MB52-C2 TaxID=3070999 RepID=UPI00280BA400|nr:hypothetical protein [Tissierella sp. MB52-C2]WMM25003.1 hypothetical protein RBU61_19065 [Tissierella sp. MB52-C2]